MKIKMIRSFHSDTTTIGTLFVNNIFECFTLEDAVRDTKIKRKTAIPEGTYDIKYREVVTPMTEKYRKRYKKMGFKYHLELQNVPNYKYVYIHIGNTPKDTEGCILVGDSLNENTKTLLKSTQAFTRLYPKIRRAFNKGERVSITIINN
jgi:hypothetical protein